MEYISPFKKMVRVISVCAALALIVIIFRLFTIVMVAVWTTSLFTLLLFRFGKKRHSIPEEKRKRVIRVCAVMIIIVPLLYVWAMKVTLPTTQGTHSANSSRAVFSLCS